MKLVRPKLWKVLAAVGAIALVCVAATAAARAQDAQEAAATPASAFAPVSADDNYKIGTGDKLRITVYGEDDLSGAFDVDGDGFVSAPLIGPVKVAGLSAHDAEQMLMAKYADGYLKEPRINVAVSQFRPFYILGEVNRPGQYPYANGMTVTNAVADAGGYTQKAVESGFYVKRNGETKEVYVEDGGNTKIYPGDIVRIDSSTFWDALAILGPLSGFAALGAAYHN
jgi:protein involved in polysaccharide export with SLBB domain